ncbi:hypothetical protein D9M69_625700 [compost metagenome]
MVQGGKVVARVGFEGHHTAGHPAVPGFVVQQCQHGLVASVHAIEVADGERAAGWRPAGGAVLQVPESSDDFHGRCPPHAGCWARFKVFVTEALYIDT